MLALLEERRVGDREPFELAVDLGETTDISSQLVKFYMYPMDFGAAAKVDAGVATKTDITAQEKAAQRVSATAPPKSVWLLSYTPSAADVDTVGNYLADFEVLYAGSQSRHYPPGDEWLRVAVMPR